MPDIKRRSRLAWACHDRSKRELYAVGDIPFMLKLLLLKTEVMETLLYRLRCVARSVNLMGALF